MDEGFSNCSVSLLKMMGMNKKTIKTEVCLDTDSSGEWCRHLSFTESLRDRSLGL